MWLRCFSHDMGKCREYNSSSQEYRNKVNGNGYKLIISRDAITNPSLSGQLIGAPNVSPACDKHLPRTPTDEDRAMMRCIRQWTRRRRNGGDILIVPSDVSFRSEDRVSAHSEKENSDN